MPTLGEPEIIHAALPAGCAVLELGAGAGRITHPLVSLGHTVVAVDNSAEMLASIRGAETVLADIDGLDLGRRFPAVVLASNFINTVDQIQRRAFLSSCTRHVLPAGQVLLQGFPRDWAPNTEWSEHGDIRLRLRRVSQDGRHVSGEMEYLVGGRQYLHEFESQILMDEELDADLAAVGLRRERALDPGGSWIEAVPG